MPNQEALEARYHQLRNEYLQSEVLEVFPPEEKDLVATFAGAFVTGLESKGRDVTVYHLLLKESLQGTLGGIISWTAMLKDKPNLHSTILGMINASEAARKYGRIQPDQFEGVITSVGLAELE